MDEILHHLRNHGWDDDSLVNTNKQWFPVVLTWCRILFIHRMAGELLPVSFRHWDEPGELYSTEARVRLSVWSKEV